MSLYGTPAPRGVGAQCHDLFVDTSERHVVELRRHGLGLLGVAWRITAICLISGYLLGILPRWLHSAPGLLSSAKWLVIGLAALLITVLLLGRFKRWAVARADVTTRRLTIRSRLRGNGWEIPMLSIVDVSSQSGALQRIFGTGSLIIRTNFAQQPAVVLDVPRVADVRDAILELRAREWSAYQRSTAAAHYGTDPGAAGSGLRAAS